MKGCVSNINKKENKETFPKKEREYLQMSKERQILEQPFQ